MVKQHLFVCVLVLALALPMFFAPSDGAVVRRRLGHCRKKGEYKKAVFPCDGPCKIRLATARGSVDMVGRVGKRDFPPLLCGRKCFCRGFSKKPKWEKCKKKKGYKIRKQHVSFVLKCKKKSRNIRMTVKGNIKQPTARRPIPDPVFVVGYIEGTQQKIIKVRCDGNCDVKSINVTYNGSVDIYVNTYSNLRNILKDCKVPKCICVGYGNRGKATCRMKKNYAPSNILHMKLEPSKDVYNVIVHYRIGNILSINLLNPGLLAQGHNPHVGVRFFYMVKCIGPCDVQSNLTVIYKDGGSLRLLASESSIRRDLVSCTNPKCICGNSSHNNTHATCSMMKKVSNDTFYIMYEGLKNTKDPTLHQKISNFWSIKKITPECGCDAGKSCDRDGTCQ